jgi:exodeoxyribonuclease V alpha subunit
MREKTDLSCSALNEMLGQALNKNESVPGCRFRIDDKVIQTRNDYEHDIVNGDIGYVRAISKELWSLVVEFENPSRIVTLDIFENDLELAYAITGHKFQGSEAPIIVVPIFDGFSPLVMQRSWLYTAISRAQKLCVLVGQSKEIPKIINRVNQQYRLTRLEDYLQES